MSNDNQPMIPQPDLPEILPRKHSDLMNVFYDFWQKISAERQEMRKAGIDIHNPCQAEIAAVMPAKVNAAVILGNFNYQVCNGGFNQYAGNGYDVSINAVRSLYDSANKLGIGDGRAGEVVGCIDQFIQGMKDEMNYRDDCNNCGDCDYCDGVDNGYNDDEVSRRYYAIANEEAMMQDILDAFEAVAAHGFMSGAFRKAA